MTIRHDAMEAIRDLVADIDGTGSWTVDFSKPGQVELGIIPLQVRMQQVSAGAQKRDSIQIRDGVEEHRAVFTSPAPPSEAGLEVLIEYVGVLSPSQDPVLRVSEVIGNVIRAIGGDAGLGGLVNRVQIARVEEPAYDPNGRVVGVTMRAAVIYQYTAGSTI